MLQYVNWQTDVAPGCIHLQGQAVQLLPGAAHSLLSELLSLPVSGSIQGTGVLEVYSSYF